MKINFLNKKIFYIFIGFLIIFYTIYYRIFVKRLPKNLFLFDNLNYKLIFIIIIGIFTSILILYKSILVLNNKNQNNSNLLNKLSIKFNEILDEVMLETYNFCQNNVKNSYDKCSNIAQNFYNFWGHKHEGFLIFISLSIKFSIVLAFLVDVFVFFELKYFYMMLYLLIINIIINILIFILKDFVKNLEDIKSCLNFTTTINEKEGSYSVVIEPSEGNEDIDLAYHIEQYKICNKITGYLKAYDFYNQYYIIRLSIVIYSLYLFGWLYILLTNIIICIN